MEGQDVQFWEDIIKSIWPVSKTFISNIGKDTILMSVCLLYPISQSVLNLREGEIPTDLFGSCYCSHLSLPTLTFSLLSNHPPCV
jgi:hypothetical protein